MEDLTSAVANREPGIEQPEAHGGHDEEVHRRDVVSVIPKERVPSLALIAVGIPFREVSRDRGNPKEDPELLELGVDLSSAPAVLIRKSADQRLHLSWNRRSTRSGLRDRAPVEPESLAMPSGHNVGLDDDEDFFPSRPSPRQQDQKPRWVGVIWGR